MQDIITKTILKLMQIQKLIASSTLIAALSLILTACTTSSTTDESAYTGSGTDKLPLSPCVSCDKEPFYKAGRWVL